MTLSKDFERLKAENERLKSLLEKNGISWQAGDHQDRPTELRCDNSRPSQRPTGDQCSTPRSAAAPTGVAVPSVPPPG